MDLAIFLIEISEYYFADSNRPVQSIGLTSLTYTLKSDLNGSPYMQRTSLKVQTLLKKK